jgi:hypothetical protein
MLEKRDVKIGLKREKVEAAKMKTQAGMMKAMDETSNIALVKMTQEAKILMENMSNTYPLARAWYARMRDVPRTHRKEGDGSPSGGGIGIHGGIGNTTGRGVATRDRHTAGRRRVGCRGGDSTAHAVPLIHLSMKPKKLVAGLFEELHPNFYLYSD